MANFLFILTTSHHEKATRCFQFAKVAHMEGHGVKLFLVDGGVEWAMQQKESGVRTDTGDCAADYLPYLVEQGVGAGVCTPCARSRGLGEAAFHPNMKLEGGPQLIGAAAGSTVMTF